MKGVVCPQKAVEPMMGKKIPGGGLRSSQIIDEATARGCATRGFRHKASVAQTHRGSWDID
jgi:hypothetical protein